MEPYQGMTRYSLRRVMKTVLRRWYWPLIFAVGSALIISYIFLSRYNSTFQVSSTLIPLDAQTNHYTISALVKNDEVLDAVSKSVEFKTTIGELNDAIKIDTDMNSVAVIVHIFWDNEEQAIEILQALKANLSFAVMHSAEAGGIKWMDAASSENGQLSSSDVQTYQIFVIGALVGLFLGMCFSFLLGTTDKRVFDLEAVNYGGEVNVIGAVGKSKEKRSKRTIDQASGMVESLPNQQLVATALHLNRLLETQDKKLLMCISPTRGCGASSVTHSIAKVLSGIKNNILIVKPSIEAKESEKPEVRLLYPGVYEYSLMLGDLESYETLVGEISKIASKAGRDFELTLVDCPALLENIQLSLAAESMDATLLICGYGKTKYEEVRSAVALLSRAGATSIYCAWNYADESYSEFYPGESATSVKEEEVKPIASKDIAARRLAENKARTAKPAPKAKTAVKRKATKKATTKKAAVKKKAAEPTAENWPVVANPKANNKTSDKKTTNKTEEK